MRNMKLPIKIRHRARISPPPFLFNIILKVLMK